MSKRRLIRPSVGFGMKLVSMLSLVLPTFVFAARRLWRILSTLPGVHTVWNDASGRHSSNPHFPRCGVGYHTDTGESVWLPPPGLSEGLKSAGRQSWILGPGCDAG
eukprot:6486411-Amphidinium_carterae.1